MLPLEPLQDRSVSQISMFAPLPCPCRGKEAEEHPKVQKQTHYSMAMRHSGSQELNISILTKEEMQAWEIDSFPKLVLLFPAEMCLKGERTFSICFFS